MSNITRLAIATLSLGLFARAAPANDWHFPTIRFTFKVGVDVQSPHDPKPSAPWWAYFPQENHATAPPAGPAYPHWPASFPQSGQSVTPPQQINTGPNVVFGWTPSAVQPASYLQAPPPSYWYGR